MLQVYIGKRIKLMLNFDLFLNHFHTIEGAESREKYDYDEQKNLV